MKSIKVLAFCFLASAALQAHAVSAATVADATISTVEPRVGGGDDKEKKEKKEKGGRKEKDESTKDAKTEGESVKPSQHARASAKGAVAAQKLMKKELMYRAKVRLFFHDMFNTKYGKPVNFRKTRARNRWSKGRKGIF